MPPHHAPRAPWHDPLDVLIHAATRVVQGHEDYAAAKSGDADAALRLVAATISVEAIEAMRSWERAVPPTLLPVHALEESGVNAIPLALAEELGERLAWPVSTAVVQMNFVGHTGASGFQRLARQALFEGDIQAGVDHVLVDDFVGQGGTLANLRGHVLACDGSVVDVNGADGEVTLLAARTVSGHVGGTPEDSWTGTRRMVGRPLRSRLRLPH